MCMPILRKFAYVASNARESVAGFNPRAFGREVLNGLANELVLSSSCQLPLLAAT